MSILRDLSRHPCFNADSRGSCGRVHLPVAPRCNIQCNYCNRRYDCVNESRPGVTSAVLLPEQAVAYVESVLQKAPNITVAGIAGPGDPMANPEATLGTLRLLKERFPHLLLCLSSNGLRLTDHVDELADLGVSHVTVTVNAVDPKVGEKIYRWVRDGKVIVRGLEGAEHLLRKQLSAITALKRRGITVKVNTIIVPSVNDHHVEEVARKMAELGVDVLNCMPMHPNQDTPFEAIEEPGKERMEAIRAVAERYLPQMRHCTRCRADAVGLLDQDCSGALRGELLKAAQGNSNGEVKPYVAVATREGMLVNLHLGEAKRFQIWNQTESGFECVGERPAPEPGGGESRWRQLGDVLNDCRAVLVSGVGDSPRQVLASQGIGVIEMQGLIVMGLEAVYGGVEPTALKIRRQGGGCSKGQGCTGTGDGC